MALQAPRLAWTLFVVPRSPPSEGAVAWPELVRKHFGDVELGRTDPIDRVVRGPFPVRLLASAASDGAELVLSGLGDAVAITVIVTQVGPSEKGIPTSQLRASAIAALGGEETGEADLLTSLRAESEWDVGGLCEIEAGLFEGLPADLPAAPGWRDCGELRIHRAAGVGAGHAAWHLEAWFMRESELPTAEQRLIVLTRGFGTLVPSFVDYGWAATKWGLAARQALRAREAVDAVIEEVRIAATAAVSGGDAISDGSVLAARLELSRTRLREVVEQLRAEIPGLKRAARRVVGQEAEIGPDGPFVEASARGQEMVDVLAGREAAAGRWAVALAAVRGAVSRVGQPA